MSNKSDSAKMIQHVVSQYKINEYKQTHKIPKVHTVGLYDADRIVHRQNKHLLQKNLPRLVHRTITPDEAKTLDDKLNSNQGLINALDLAQSEPKTPSALEPKFDVNDVKSGRLVKRWTKGIADYDKHHIDDDDDLTNRDPDSSYIKFDALNRVAPKGFPKEIQHISKIKQEAPTTFQDAVGQIGTSPKAYQKDIHHNISNAIHKSNFNDFNKSASKELGRKFHESNPTQRASTRGQNSARTRAVRKALATKHSRQR